MGRPSSIYISEAGASAGAGGSGRMDNDHGGVGPCCGWMEWIFLVSGPFFAFSYTFVVWLTYVVFKEVPLLSNGVAFFLRISLLTATVLCGYGICSNIPALAAAAASSKESDKESLILNHSLTIIYAMGCIFWIFSYFLIKQTRQYDVVGVSRTPYFGSKYLQGQFFAITGANNGIGKETTIQLAKMGGTIFMLCRSEKRAKAAIQDILNKNSKNDGDDEERDIDIQPSQLIFVHCDLGNFSSIRQAVKDLTKIMVEKRQEYEQSKKQNTKTQQRPRLNALINNAGLMMGTQTMSQDGLELMMQANHLGHYLLSRLVLEVKDDLMDVQATKSDSDGSAGDEDDRNDGINPARVLFLTSSTYQFSTDGFDFEDMFCDKAMRPYTLFGQYSMTKLANILTAQELQRKYPTRTTMTTTQKNHRRPVRVFAVHPGIVRTNVTSNMQWIMRFLDSVFRLIVESTQKTAAEGAYGSVYCAASPTQLLPKIETENDHTPSSPSTSLVPSSSCQYIVNCRLHPLNIHAQSKEDARQLWCVSEELVGLTNSDATDDSINDRKTKDEKKNN